ncbi:surface-adhesin E family protein [Acinetobacter baumannii]
MKKVLICLSTITVTSNTVAANWGFFLESNGVKQYLDRDSLNIDSKKNTVSYWEKREGKLGTEKGKKVSKYLALNKFYCNDNAYQIIEFHTYDASGLAITNVIQPSSKIRIVPDSISEDMYLAACEDTK